MTGSDFTLYRKSYRTTGGHQVETPPSGRGLLVGVALRPGHRRRIYDGARASTCHFAQDSCYIRPFSEPYRAEMETGFDFLLLEIASSALSRAFCELALAPAEGLSCIPGAHDPVLAHLARALLPALEEGAHAPRLFIDQLMCALQTHLARRYHGGTPREEKALGLSRVELARAKDMLAEGFDGQVLIADVASACNVSRSYFIRAFKAATGLAPYQWLLRQRVARASDLLINSQLPLAEVAACCGFSDQSHMTRTFTRLTGHAPGALRRQHTLDLPGPIVQS